MHAGTDADGEGIREMLDFECWVLDEEIGGIGIILVLALRRDWLVLFYGKWFTLSVAPLGLGEEEKVWCNGGLITNF